MPLRMVLVVLKTKVSLGIAIEVLIAIASIVIIVVIEEGIEVVAETKSECHVDRCSVIRSEL